MDIKNSDLLKETINFVENIEFSEFQPKTEIKEEEGLNQEVWKSPQLDIKPKLEQLLKLVMPKLKRNLRSSLLMIRRKICAMNQKRNIALVTFRISTLFPQTQK